MSRVPAASAPAVPSPDARPSRPARTAALALALVLAALFGALGTWQVERRAWKLDLIARVEARLGAEAVAAPARPDWPSVSREAHEYRRVRLDGRFLPGRTVRVMAVTARGPGFWLMTPLVTEAGDTVLVNRGFVAPDAGDGPDPGPAGATVTGLLRMPEPGGGFLRRNDPAAGRWYSRDVAAIAAAGGLGPVAPFFVDADASANGPGRPEGGLTVVTFRNGHLVYALTWFALCAMSAGAAALLLAGERRR